MLLIGCSPAGRNTEQHDIFFGIGDDIRDVLPDAISFWPEANNTFHLDAWREVTMVNGYAIEVTENPGQNEGAHLFFINLGGYKKGEFEEFHYKMLVAARDKNEAIKQSKQTAFFRHTGFKGANAHIDDKYGIAIDDMFLVKDILPQSLKSKYGLRVINQNPIQDAADEIFLGYFRPDKIDKWAPVLPGNK